MTFGWGPIVVDGDLVKLDQSESTHRRSRSLTGIYISYVLRPASGDRPENPDQFPMYRVVIDVCMLVRLDAAWSVSALSDERDMLLSAGKS